MTGNGAFIGTFLARCVDKETRTKQSVETRNSRVGDNESLLETVRRFECLWKVQSRAYKDLRTKVIFPLLSSLCKNGKNRNASLCLPAFLRQSVRQP